MSEQLRAAFSRVQVAAERAGLDATGWILHHPSKSRPVPWIDSDESSAIYGLPAGRLSSDHDTAVLQLEAMSAAFESASRSKVRIRAGR